MDIQLDWGFQSLVDQLQDGVFLIEDGRLNYVNDILCEMLGYPREELIGSHFPEFIAEADRDRVIETHRRRLDGENVPSSYRFRILRKDGVETNVSLQVGFTPGGRTVVGTVKDLSQLEETLSEMERLKTALEQIVLKLPDIYYRTDMQGKLVRLSPSVQDILGYPPSEVLGRPITDFYVNGQERIQIVKKILEAKGDVVRVEAPLLHRDGREVWFCTNAYLVLDENNQPIGIEGLARDDTHRKQLEDRLQKRTLELEKSRNDILRLTDFTREINESTDMEHIVDRILKFATEEFQFEGAAVFLLSSDRKHLEFYRGFFPKPEEGINESNLKNLRIPLVKGGGFHAKVFMRKRPLFLPRFRALEENQEIPGLGKSMLHNILIQPLTIRDECIGLMDFTRFTSPLQLNKQDLKKISHFADQIVSAIRNSRLLRETTHARDVMEGEVDLARKVQENLISQRNPDRNIAAVYRPMMAVGGDFYEFLRFRDSGNIGIFVSDVSGHGVAAAFITSMIKTILLQSREIAADPGRLLHFINDAMEKLNVDHFITVFYGIYDPSDRSITYANAGHNYPLILTENGVRELSRGRSLPLGILTGTEMEEAGKRYLSTTEILPSGSRLFLFTDGLVEAVPAGGGLPYQESRLNKALVRFRQEAPAAFLDRILADLQEHRNSDRFEDDVCMICVDVK